MAQNAGPSLETVGLIVQNAGLSIQNSGLSVHNPGWSAQNVGLSAENAGLSVQNARPSVQNASLPERYVNNDNRSESHHLIVQLDIEKQIPQDQMKKESASHPSLRATQSVTGRQR